MTWPTKPISEFCKTGTGTTPLRAEGDRFYGGSIPWVKSGELSQGVVCSTEETLTDEALEAVNIRLIEPGALLVALYGATVGQIAELGIQATTNQAVCHVIPDPKIADKRYLYYALRRQAPVWIGQRVGGAQPNISQGIVKDTHVPLPPLPEQRRIVAILDKADAIRRKREEGIRLTEELLLSTFLEMFGESDQLSRRWKTVPFEQIVGSTKLGLVRGSPQITESGEYPYLRMDGILGDGHLQLSPIKRTDATSKEASEFRLQKNDFLFNTRNSRELVGKTALFESDDVILFNNNIMRVRFTNEVRPQYMIGLFQTPFIQKQLDSRKSGTTSVFAIYAKNLNTVEIPIPPVALQQQFCDLRNRLLSLREIRRTGCGEAKSLFDTLVQRAFRGEL